MLIQYRGVYRGVWADIEQEVVYCAFILRLDQRLDHHDVLLIVKLGQLEDLAHVF